MINANKGEMQRNVSHEETLSPEAQEKEKRYDQIKKDVSAMAVYYARLNDDDGKHAKFYRKKIKKETKEWEERYKHQRLEGGKKNIEKYEQMQKKATSDVLEVVNNTGLLNKKINKLSQLKRINRPLYLAALNAQKSLFDADRAASNKPVKGESQYEASPRTSAEKKMDSAEMEQRRQKALEIIRQRELPASLFTELPTTEQLGRTNLESLEYQSGAHDGYEIVGEGREKHLEFTDDAKELLKDPVIREQFIGRAEHCYRAGMKDLVENGGFNNGSKETAQKYATFCRALAIQAGLNYTVGLYHKREGLLTNTLNDWAYEEGWQPDKYDDVLGRAKELFKRSNGDDSPMVLTDDGKKAFQKFYIKNHVSQSNLFEGEEGMDKQALKAFVESYNKQHDNKHEQSSEERKPEYRIFKLNKDNPDNEKSKKEKLQQEEKKLLDEIYSNKTIAVGEDGAYYFDFDNNTTVDEYSDILELVDGQKPTKENLNFNKEAKEWLANAVNNKHSYNSIDTFYGEFLDAKQKRENLEKGLNDQAYNEGWQPDKYDDVLGRAKELFKRSNGDDSPLILTPQGRVAFDKYYLDNKDSFANLSDDEIRSKFIESYNQGEDNENEPGGADEDLASRVDEANRALEDYARREKWVGRDDYDNFLGDARDLFTWQGNTMVLNDKGQAELTKYIEDNKDNADREPIYLLGRFASDYKKRIKSERDKRVNEQGKKLLDGFYGYLNNHSSGRGVFPYRHNYRRAFSDDSRLVTAIEPVDRSDPDSQELKLTDEAMKWLETADKYGHNYDSVREIADEIAAGSQREIRLTQALNDWAYNEGWDDDAYDRHLGKARSLFIRPVRDGRLALSSEGQDAFRRFLIDNKVDNISSMNGRQILNEFVDAYNSGKYHY